jgi:hypothetical protein
MTMGLNGKTYEEKCKEAGLEALEERRKNQDLSREFKILKGIDRIKQDSIFVRGQGTQHTRQSSSPPPP